MATLITLLDSANNVKIYTSISSLASDMEANFFDNGNQVSYKTLKEMIKNGQHVIRLYEKIELPQYDWIYQIQVHEVFKTEKKTETVSQ